jgi:hypothetical protein
MGCAAAQVKENHRLQNVSDEELASEEEAKSESRTCAFGACENVVIGDKRVKYCEDHKDPKNRKE